MESILNSIPASPDVDQQEMDAKIAIFEEEIEMITDPKIKSFVRAVLKNAEPFWVSPASMIEDEHPPDEYGPEGMIIHTKRVFRICIFLMNTCVVSQAEADCVFAAALLHDITKAFWVDETSKVVMHDAMHPYTVDAFVRACRQFDDEQGVHPPQDNTLEIDKEQLDLILKLIRFSHGIFSPIPETIPKTELENVVHMADFLASKLHLIVDGADINPFRWLEWDPYNDGDEDEEGE